MDEIRTLVRLDFGGADRIAAVLEQRGQPEVHAPAVGRGRRLLDLHPSTIQFRRTVGARVLITIVFHLIRRRVSGRLGIDWTREAKSKSLGPNPNRLDLKRRLAR